MAGIGFALRHLQARNTLTAHSLAVGHAVVIVSGPWLISVISLFLISVLASGYVGREAVDTFRLLIYYAYAIAFVISTPLLLVPTRLVADAFAVDEYSSARGYLAIVFAAAAAVSLAVSLVVFGLLLSLPVTTALSASICSVLLTLVFVAITYCGAIKDFVTVTKVFSVGLFASVGLVVFAAYLRADTVFLLAGFSFGLLVILTGLMARVMASIPLDDVPIAGRIAELVDGFRCYWPLTIGAAFSGLAIWVDKLVIWFSPFGEQLPSGLVHAPLYDSPVFLAYLTIVPALSVFLINVETGFLDRYRQFYTSIRNGGTLRQISAHGQDLSDDTIGRLFLLAVVQLAIALVLAIAAPLILPGLGLRFEQVAVFRFALFGAAFHLVFIVSTAMLLFLDRRRDFAAMQVLFFILNGGLTALFAYFGREYLGYGYLIASVISAMVAFNVTAIGLSDLCRHVFIPMEDR